ncbi:HAD family phosphatase [uncultured Pseudokineococcus sp.]|uniref:HAD family hydrolase n=1 Tax=uncultured Pseudokineococcus sp. TaxID=1642928 RepID=UPI002634CB31|nr:HAD family hydrolase [uncultured Pseudokineococcus sp.]
MEATPHRRRVALFDVDRTLVSRSSVLALAGPLHAAGLLPVRALARALREQVAFSLGGADHTRMERGRDLLAAQVVGWEVSVVSDVVERALHTHLAPLLFAEARALVREHQRRGDAVALVTSAAAEVAEPLGRLLGADHVLASRMAVESGRWTGLLDVYAYGEGKAVLARELADEHGYDLAASAAYSDSVTDLPLLELVGRPHAVNPDRALRRVARGRGWPVLRFRAPSRRGPRSRRRPDGAPVAGTTGRDGPARDAA